ncbi:MAG TPA: aldo/keto reductase, partial [Acidimicrobiales bacterium]|nr:aldo/keto reductase [Acidimicrobiales bacterium]
DPVVQAVAARAAATPNQVGLAWLLAHAPHVLVIPGTSSSAHLDENIDAGEVVLTTEDIAALDGIAPGTAVMTGTWTSRAGPPLLGPSGAGTGGARGWAK